MENSGTAPTGFKALIELLALLGIGILFCCTMFIIFDVPNFFKFRRA